MSEVKYVNTPFHPDSAGTRTGPHSRFTAEDDFVILREVSAEGIHFASFDENRQRYGEAARTSTQIPQFLRYLLEKAYATTNGDFESSLERTTTRTDVFPM